MNAASSAMIADCKPCAAEIEVVRPIGDGTHAVSTKQNTAAVYRMEKPLIDASIYQNQRHLSERIAAKSRYRAGEPLGLSNQLAAADAGDWLSSVLGQLGVKIEVSRHSCDWERLAIR